MNIMGMKNYFYAEDDAELYDATVRLTTEPYDLLHAQVQRLVTYWSDNKRAKSDDRPLIVDLGCGTGMEALAILKQVKEADVVCIDVSARMLDVLRQKLKKQFGDETGQGRCRTVRGDVRDDDVITKAVAEAGFAGRPVSLAVSVYALHHLTAEEKRDLYRVIVRSLGPNSAFICGDMYSFAQEAFGEFAQALEESWIQNAFRRHEVDLKLTPAEVARLTNAWLTHSQEENIPLPISQSERIVTSEDIETESSLLFSAGFRRVGVPFRFFQNGIIWAEV